jgi:hypothetical protein
MRSARLQPVSSVDVLPAVEAVDGIAPEALPTFIAQCAAHSLDVGVKTVP